MRREQGFTLTEMLVASVVGAIVVAGTYASYQVIERQYTRVSEMSGIHASGRAVMAMLARDIRMAGYAHRGSSGAYELGAISDVPLVIKDAVSGCCDDVTVIYDYNDKKGSGQTERRKIRYWGAEYPSVGSGRYRLYKKVDVIAPSSKAKIGATDVLADYSEAFDVSNVSGDSYIYYGGYHHLYMLNSSKGSIVSDYGIGYNPLRFEMGPDGLLYMICWINYDTKVVVFDTSARKEVKTFGSKITDIHFGPDGLLYALANNGLELHAYDPASGKLIRSASTGLSNRFSLAMDDSGNIYVAGATSVEVFSSASFAKIKEFKKQSIGISGSVQVEIASDGKLYVGEGSSNLLQVFDVASGRQTNTLWVPGGGVYGMDHDPYGNLYVSSSNIEVIDLSTGKVIRKINKPYQATRTSDLAYDPGSLKEGALVNLYLRFRSKSESPNQRTNPAKPYFVSSAAGKKDGFWRDEFSTAVLARNIK
jgi:prepilin-type N-terminal cleavage/methylation domain-containing protein